MTCSTLFNKNRLLNSLTGKWLAFLFASLLLIPGCNTNKNPSGDATKQSAANLPAASDDYFQEIGKEAGIDFVHSIGDDDLHNIIESSSGGTAFLDYDQDGYIDLYICSGTWMEGFSKEAKPDKIAENHLYRNNGNGTFSDVTKRAGVGGPWYSMGLTVGDFNNDGFPDIFLSNYGPNVLL